MSLYSVNVFLSYASEQKDVARSIEIALRGEGHSVFLDRSALEAGETYNDQIREAIAASDLFVFLITPEALAAGRYTLTELELADASGRARLDTSCRSRCARRRSPRSRRI